MKKRFSDKQIISIVCEAEAGVSARAWTDAVEVTVAPGLVMKDFNVIEDIRPGQIPGFVYSLPDAFFFKRAEERFGHRFIPAIATRAHARRQVIGPAEALPCWLP